MNDTIERWKRTSIIAMVLCAAIAVSPYIKGSAVEKAPVAARGFEFSAATTPVQNGADTTFSLEAGFGPCASVLLANDGTNISGTTDSDLFVSLNAITAPAPASTAASTTFRLKSGDKFNIDGRWSRCTLRGATANVTARVIATY